MSEIPTRWQATWLDWEESLSGYAWKETAMRAVRELGAAEAKVAEQAATIERLELDNYNLRCQWKISDDLCADRGLAIERLTQELTQEADKSFVGALDPEEAQLLDYVHPFGDSGMTIRELEENLGIRDRAERGSVRLKEETI